MFTRFLAALAIGLLSPTMVFAASAKVSAPIEVQQGQTFQVRLAMTDAFDVDTVRFIGAYSSDLIEYISISNGTALPMRSPGSATGSGLINFGGFSLGDTAFGTVTAGTVTFKALKPGIAKISLSDGTRILAYGKDQLTDKNSIRIRIVAKPPLRKRNK